MADSPRLLQRFQYGKETTPGVAVAETRQFSGLEIMPNGRADRSAIFPTGAILPTGTQTRRKWTELGLSSPNGYGYDELPHLLSMYVGAPTITTPATAVNARQHQWLMVNGVIPSPVTYTGAYGDVNNGRRAAYIHGQDLTLNFSRAGGGNSIDGSLMAQPLQTPFTLATTGVTVLPMVPVEGAKTDWYLDSTFAGLGTSKLLRAFGGSLGLGGVTGRFFPQNSAVPGFGGIVATRPDSSFEMRLGADTVGEPVAYSEGTTYYVRCETKGALIDAGIAVSAYRLTIDVCLQCMETGDFDEEDSLQLIAPTFAIINDPTAGFGIRIQVVNTITAL